MVEIDCSYTDEVVCPYCGYKFCDSWDFAFYGDMADITCNSCEKTFEAYRTVDVSYTSYKKAGNDDGND